MFSLICILIQSNTINTSSGGWQGILYSLLYFFVYYSISVTSLPIWCHIIYDRGLIHTWTVKTSPWTLWSPTTLVKHRSRLVATFVIIFFFFFATFLPLLTEYLFVWKDNHILSHRIISYRIISYIILLCIMSYHIIYHIPSLFLLNRWRHAKGFDASIVHQIHSGQTLNTLMKDRRVLTSLCERMAVKYH